MIITNAVPRSPRIPEAQPGTIFAACDLQCKSVPSQCAKAAAVVLLMTFSHNLLAEQAKTPLPAPFQCIKIATANVLVGFIKPADEMTRQGGAVE